MQITPEYLIDLRQQMEQQRLTLLSHIQQIVGGIAMLDAIAARLNDLDKAAVSAPPAQET